MALCASFACFVTGTHSVAFPALFVSYYFCTECFISNMFRPRLMALRTYISPLRDLFRLLMAGLAIDPGRTKIIRMRSYQLLGVYRMVTIDTFDPEIPDVHLMAKKNFTD